MTPTRTRAGWLASAAMLWWLACCSHAHAQAVTLSGSVVGSTPSTLGYNVGDFHSNQTASWWRYSGVNGARMFTSPATLTPASLFKSSTNASLNASTQAQFLSQRTALRNTGTATTYINWSSIYTNYTSNIDYGSNSVDAQFADATVKAAGGKTLVVMQRTPGSYAWPTNASDNSATDWQNRWLGWQQWYAQAFVRARYEDVEDFQLFNEPDLYGSSLSEAQWIEMVKYGANAVESAIADVNRIFGKSLTPHISGPVTNGPSLTTVSGTDWGDVLLQNRNTPVLSGSAVPGYQLFDHFDYHNYGSNPTTFGTKLAGAISDLNTLTGGQGANYGVTISEFNTRTSANYDPADPVNNPNGYTPDSLAMSSRLGQIVVNLANNKPDELYLFKFSNAGGANNGVHWQSATSGDVGGATKSADVYRLFTEGFAGKDLLAAPVTSDPDLSLAASRDATSGTRYLMAANADTANSHALSLDLTPWGVAAGTRVTVEQVSDRFSGNISQTIDVGLNRTITVNTDAGGVVLVTVPQNQSATRTVIPVSQDANVRHANRTTNYGSSADLLVQSGSGSGSRYVSYMQFSLAGVDVNNLTEATLGVYGWDPGATGDSTASIICHVYGLTSGTFNESTINWSNAPNIDNTAFSGVTGLIDDTYTTGVGTSAEVIGQIAATGTEKLLALDVSRWLRERVAANATSVTFMITRDFRFDGDIDSTHWLRMRSSEYSTGAFGPTLTVTAVPEPTAAVLVVVGLGSARLMRRWRPRKTR